jgi:hypothetical protein
MEQAHYIYTLIDPRTHEVMYVGKTIDPETRFRCYRKINWPHMGRKVHYWLEDLSASGNEVVIRVVEICTKKNGLVKEKKWIDFYRTRGAPLLNHFGVTAKFRISGGGNGAG